MHDINFTLIMLNFLFQSFTQPEYPQDNDYIYLCLKMAKNTSKTSVMQTKKSQLWCFFYLDILNQVPENKCEMI